MNTAPVTAAEREVMILAHLPQVELLARRLHQRCPQVELEDLVSAGTIGLIRAVDRFDPSRGFKLKTLAEHKIRGAMLDYLREIDPLPRSVRQFQKRRDAVLSRWEDPENPPHGEEVAALLGIPASRYYRFSAAIEASNHVSLSSLG